MVSIRRRTKCIDSIKQEDGTVVSEQSDISNAIYGFFEQKWMVQGIIEDGWPSLKSQKNYLAQFAGVLDGEVTKDEIWAVVRSLGRNKAPGGDGITASFFKYF
ncbi:hypothetical protein MA16_Dca026870 [Dendrobium catenatum]|uniref:Uncharacterized protein n=1 Tax=Dendrobium catenatum TaxID=906689 RepID=A0A2I0WWU8_9ASPA|nr:hypothetical protein MA16_Dca026870 [Dendrobium catenatum]